ncbi:MAG: ABC transporter substrate-binding protein [Acidimicrobiales bacterium]
MRRTRWMRMLGVFAGLMLVATACGGRDDDDDAGGGGGDGGEDGGELATGPGFDGETIRLGVLTPTSGDVAVIGNPLTAGNEAYFAAVNAEGGVAGQFPVELVIRDTGFQEALAAQEYAAIKDDVVMFAQILGTQINTSLLGSLEADNVVGAPASLDSLWVREQQMVPIGAPYQIQSINGLSYLLDSGTATTEDVLCVLRSSDLFGEAGLEGVEFGAEELGWNVAEVQQFPAGGQDFTAQIGALASAGCEVVHLTATPGDGARALGTAAGGGFAPQWIANSPMWLTAAYAAPGREGLAQYVSQRVLIVSEGPAYGDESVPGMADLVANQGDTPPDIYFNFGYLQARAVHQVLEAAVELGDLSREGIVEALNSLDELTFDGLLGDYGWGGPDDRNPPRVNSIFRPNLTLPTGLELVESGIESEVAQAFEFTAE